MGTREHARRRLMTTDLAGLAAEDPSRAPIAISSGHAEVLGGEADGHAAFADGGRDHLGRAGADVGEDSRPARLEQARVAVEVAPRVEARRSAGCAGRVSTNPASSSAISPTSRSRLLSSGDEKQYGERWDASRAWEV
jgi:hypothetical protein